MLNCVTCVPKMVSVLARNDPQHHRHTSFLVCEIPHRLKRGEMDERKGYFLAAA